MAEKERTEKQLKAHLYYLANREKYVERSKLRQCSPERKAYQKQYGLRTDTKTMKARILTRAKCRANKLGLPFNISSDDFEIPTCCPILGIPLRKAMNRQDDSSPALDKIIPELGYVKGNIHVISQRANVLKRDASVEELQKLVDYLRRITQ